MDKYLWHNDIKFMDYAAYVKGGSQRIKKAAAEPFHQAGLPVIHLDSPEVDKDATARQIACERGSQEGVERGNSVRRWRTGPSRRSAGAPGGLPVNGDSS